MRRCYKQGERGRDDRLGGKWGGEGTGVKGRKGKGERGEGEKGLLRVFAKRE